MVPQLAATSYAALAGMSEQTLQLVESIRRRLSRSTWRAVVADASYGLLLTAGVLALAWAVAATVEASWWLSPWPRAVVFAIVLLLVGGVFVAFAARPLLQLLRILPAPSENQVAQRIGARYPEVGDRLVNLLDLSSGRASASTPGMVDGAVRMLGLQVKDVPFEHVEDFSRPKRALKMAAVPLVLLLSFAIMAPNAFFGASGRLAAVGAHFERPAPYDLSVIPGSVEVIRGQDVQTRVTANGRRTPETVTLALNQEGEEHVERIEVQREKIGSRLGAEEEEEDEE